MEQAKTLPTFVSNILGVIGGLIAGYILKSGLFTADQLKEVGGAALTIIGAGWAWWQAHHTKNKLQDAIDAPAGQAKPVGFQ